MSRFAGLSRFWGAFSWPRASAFGKQSQATPEQILSQLAVALRAGVTLEDARAQLEREVSRCGVAGGRLGYLEGAKAWLDRILRVGQRNALRSAQWAKRARNSMTTAERTGLDLASVLEGLARLEAAEVDANVARQAAIAGPQASARLLAALPLVAAIAGQLAGMHTVETLLGSAVGWMLLAIGAVCAGFGALWSHRLLLEAKRQSACPQQAAIAFAAWLLAAQIQNGSGLTSALRETATAANLRHLAVAANSIDEGEDPDSPSDPVAARLWEALEPNWQRGSNPLPALELAVTQALRQRKLAISWAAGQVSVRLTLPLALCYLPAFVALAVIPAVIGLLPTLTG